MAAKNTVDSSSRRILRRPFRHQVRHAQPGLAGAFQKLAYTVMLRVKPLQGALIVAGQILNFSVFRRLGKIGVFYGNKFGYEIPWHREFPFSFLKHPQYIGALVSIWGFFLALRFPHDDWFLVPMLETVYYALGIYFEQ